MKFVKYFIMFAFGLVVLVGCEKNNSSDDKPDSKNEISQELQQKILLLNGLSTIEFLSEISGLLSTNNVQLSDANQLAKQLDLLFELKCIDVCIIRKKNERLL